MNTCNCEVIVYSDAYGISPFKCCCIPIRTIRFVVKITITIVRIFEIWIRVILAAMVVVYIDGYIVVLYYGFQYFLHIVIILAIHSERVNMIDFKIE